MIDIDAVRLRVAEEYEGDIEELEATLAMMLADIKELVDEVERLQKGHESGVTCIPFHIQTEDERRIADHEYFALWNDDIEWATKPAYLDDPTLVPIQGPWRFGEDPLLRTYGPAFAEQPLLDDWGRKHI